MIKKFTIFLTLACFALPAAAQEAPPRGYAMGQEAADKTKPQYTYLYDTSLTRAVKNNDEHRINILLFSHVDPNEPNDETFTPLVLAGQHTGVEGVRMLLQKGAKVNLPAKYNLTALMTAGANGRDDVVNLLLEYGADPNLKDDLGMSALTHAAKGNHLKTAQILAAAPYVNLEIKNNAGLNALLYAVYNRNDRLVKTLAQKGANLNTPDLLGRTPLFLAVENKDIFTLRALIEGKADLDAPSGSSAITPLMMAVINKDKNAASALIKAGADVNRADANGNSALTYALNLNDKSLIKLLTKNNAQDLAAQAAQAAQAAEARRQAVKTAEQEAAEQERAKAAVDIKIAELERQLEEARKLKASVAAQ
ncbi:MAG: ankyrin repeat domain-containing protein [Elusimicrobiota bacterium]|jgi:ankyrin repeat protein|nr:ankyrin repeat domain-containing protein [Elusimicrobiota bacterium]